MRVSALEAKSNNAENKLIETDDNDGGWVATHTNGKPNILVHSISFERVSYSWSLALNSSSNDMDAYYNYIIIILLLLLLLLLLIRNRDCQRRHPWNTNRSEQ